MSGASFAAANVATMDFSDLILAVAAAGLAMNSLPVRSGYSIATQLKSIRSLWINDMTIQRRYTRTGFVGMFDRMMGKKMVGKVIPDTPLLPFFA